MALTCLMLAALVPFGPTFDAAPVSILAGSGPEEDEEVIDGLWHGYFDLGGVFTDGNSNVRQVRLAAEAIKRLIKDRFTLRAAWNFSRNDGETTDDNYGAEGKWDRFLTEKFYVNLVAGWKVDREADLDNRYFIGGGVGYQFVETERTKFNGEAGLVYFHEEFDDGSEDDYLAARLAYDLDYQLTKTTLFEQTVEAFPSLEDADDFYGRADSKLSFEITETWAAFLQYILNYDNTPAEDAERVDHRVIAGLRWSF